MKLLSTSRPTIEPGISTPPDAANSYDKQRSKPKSSLIGKGRGAESAPRPFIFLATSLRLRNRHPGILRLQQRGAVLANRV